VLHAHPDDCGLRTETDQGLVAGDPVRRGRPGIGDCLDEVRLALAVAADEEHRAGLQGEVDLGVVAEVDELQVGDVHARQRSSRFGCSR